MIEIKKVSKRFDKIAAVSDVSLSIEQGQVFGLLGTNGAGKSTLLRMMAGVLKPEEGEILIDGKAVWDCVEAKQKFFYISDEQYFFPKATPLDMAAFYKTLYPAFNEKRFRKFLVKFTLQKDRKIQTFSKGMKKQLSILFGICSGVEYLFRGSEEQVMAKLSVLKPVFYECIPLSLEEIFISETEVVGYDIKNLIL